MMALELLNEIEKNHKGIATPKFISQKFHDCNEHDAKDPLNFGVQIGIFVEAITEKEYVLKDLDFITNDQILEFQNFLEKFEKNMKLYNLGKVFSLDFQNKNFEELQPFFYDRSGIWWLWNSTKFCWEMTDEIDLLNMLKKVVDKDISNSKLRTEILNSMKQKGRLNIPDPIKPSWVQFRDKIIDIETDEEIAASPFYFVANPISWKLGDSDNTPKLDKLFESWVGEEHKQELYEILAFSMVPDYFIHRIIWLTGSGSNGKSTYLKVLRKFLDESNITSVSLDSLMFSRFAGAKLLKKLVCVMGETNFNTLSKTDFLKNLSGGDPVPGEIKNKNPFDFINYAKLIMASNSMPVTADKTDGFYRRQKIIDFPNKFSIEKDVLSEISNQEMENLARKCLNIVKNLWTNRTFTNDGDFDERRRRYEEKSNPIMLYIQENFEKDINSEVLFSEFFDGLKDFLAENGFRELTKPVVTKQLKIEGLDTKLMTKNKINSHFVLGIKKKSPDKQDPQTKFEVTKL